MHSILGEENCSNGKKMKLAMAMEETLEKIMVENLKKTENRNLKKDELFLMRLSKLAGLAPGC